MITSWTQHLTRWQRFRRRLALRRGNYKHPDGTVEWAFQTRAGIEPNDSEEVREQKQTEYFRKLKDRVDREIAEDQWKGYRGYGIVLVGVGAYALASHLDLSFWETVAIVGCFVVGLWAATERR